MFRGFSQRGFFLNDLKEMGGEEKGVREGGERVPFTHRSQM